MTPILRTESCPPDPVRADSAWAAHSRPRSNHDDLESPWLPVPPAPRLRAIALPQVSPLVPVLEPATQIFANLDWTLSGITYPLSLRHTRSTCPATGPNALRLGYTPDSPIQSALGSEWSSDVSPSSPTHTTASSLLAEPSLLYTPLSPQLTPPVPGHNGPAYDRIRARSSVPSPKFKRATPQLPPPSPLYIPPTPAYSPPSPEYTPTSPAYSPPSPMYNPASPTWSPPLPSPAPRAQPLPLLYTTGICPTPKLPQRQAHTRTATSPTSRDRHLPLLYTAGSYSTPKSSHGRVLKRVAPRPSDPNLPFPKAKVTPTTLAFARRGLHSVPMIRSRGAMYPARRGPPAFVISDPMTWRATKGYSDADERAF